ncbi:MAG: penicillin-binding protein 2 [Campylobacterota bacterium]
MTKYKIILTFIALVWLVLLVRVFQISIGHGGHYEALAQQNIIKKDWILPIRGEIVDRNKKPLAVNRIGFSLNIVPHLKTQALEQTAETIIKKFSHLDRDSIIKKYRQNSSYYNHDYIQIESFIPYEQMMPHISSFERDPHITIAPATLRNYPLADAATHIVGYVGRQSGAVDDTSKVIGVTGKSGIEKQYNAYLQGELGYEMVKVNASNERVAILDYFAPIENNELQLTIDGDLQQYAHSLFKGKAGTAIVMKTDGELLAAVSYPAYDPNMFVTGISQKDWDKIRLDFDNPFTNKFINGIYPPGSVLKMGVGLAFFDAGDVNEHSTVVCNSDFEVGGHVFRCWKRDGHGRVDFRRAIRESCDDYFYKNSIKTGINKIAQVLKQTGLGERTGVDLPNEAYGTVPDIAWKHHRHNQRWYMGETIISSIGQGYMLSTPLQIARNTALMATDMLPTPHFVKPDDINATRYEPEVVKRNKDAMELIRESMTEVANHNRGTARWYVRNSKVKMAAKTGTAQVVSIPQDQKERMDEDEMEYYHRSHAWFTAYAPADDPQYVVTVLVEHGGGGGSTGGPIAADIFNWLLENGYIDEDK